MILPRFCAISARTTSARQSGEPRIPTCAVLAGYRSAPVGDAAKILRSGPGASRSRRAAHADRPGPLRCGEAYFAPASFWIHSVGPRVVDGWLFELPCHFVPEVIKQLALRAGETSPTS